MLNKDWWKDVPAEHRIKITKKEVENLIKHDYASYKQGNIYTGLKYIEKRGTCLVVYEVMD